MSNLEHLQSLADEFNARARAEGRYLEQDFWDIPSQPGSILDSPMTPESKERVARLRAQIAELNADAVEKSNPTVQGILPDVSKDLQQAQGESTKR
jgi:hypothetical protein